MGNLNCMSPQNNETDPEDSMHEDTGAEAQDAETEATKGAAPTGYEQANMVATGVNTHGQMVDGQMAVGGIGLQGTDAYPAMGVMDQSQPQLAVDGTQPPPESDMQPPSVHAQMGNQMYPATQEAPLTLDEAPVGQYGGQME